METCPTKAPLCVLLIVTTDAARATNKSTDQIVSQILSYVQMPGHIATRSSRPGRAVTALAGGVNRRS